MNNNRDNNFKKILLGKLLVVSKNEMSMVNSEKNRLIKDLFDIFQQFTFVMK